MRQTNLTEPARMRIPLAALAALLSLATVNVARAGGGPTDPYNSFYAGFDDLTEPYVASTLTDGGITFSNAQSTLFGAGVFCIDDASKSLSPSTPGYSYPNVVTINGFSSNGGLGFGRVHSLQFATGALENFASIAVFSGGDLGDQVTLAGLLNGNVVADDAFTMTGGFGQEQTLTVSAPAFDTFMVVASNTSLNGDGFFGFDSVTASIPEPTSLGAMGLIGLAVLRRRR